MSDIDAAAVESLKVLDPEWPIREADMPGLSEGCQKQTTPLFDRLASVGDERRKPSGRFCVCVVDDVG